MSVYFVKGKDKGWRYDFTLKGIRHTEAWFKTKNAARKAETERREELKNPAPKVEMPIDMVFLDLVNRRLDYLKDHKTESYYNDTLYMAKRWTHRWGPMFCSEISEDMIDGHLRERKKVSACTANADIRALRALFNYGKKKKFITANPMDDVEFFPVEKRVKYIPPLKDIDSVISVAEPDDQDYLWVIRETMGRVGEVNRMKWDDVNLEARFVILYTRKKKGGDLTPRKIPMSDKLHEVLSRLDSKRDVNKPWVFWHLYWSRKTGNFVEGPYKDRKELMQKLCEKAGVRYFRYHPLRHSGASTMDNNNVPMGSIQRILGHENRSTTEIYLHSLGDEEREAIAIYENVRKNSHTESHTE
jgi:integrase